MPNLVPVENLVIDGESENGMMEGCDKDEAGFHAPFAIFSPDLQFNVGGPYAKREHADDALKAIKEAKMVPYTSKNVTWTVNGKPSVWYDKD